MSNKPNTTLIEYYIKKYKRLEKLNRKAGNKSLAKYFKSIKVEFQDCLKVVKNEQVGYLN